MTTYLSGDLLGGAAYNKRAVQLFTELNDKQGLSSSLAMVPLSGAVGYQIETFVCVDPHLIDGVTESFQALEIARDIGWRSGEAYALWMLGRCLGTRGDYGLAVSYADEAIYVATEIGHSQWIVAAGCALGSIYLDLFALDRASALLEETLVRARETGSFHWTRTAAGTLASCYILQGDFGHAEC